MGGVHVCSMGRARCSTLAAQGVAEHCLCCAVAVGIALGCVVGGDRASWVVCCHLVAISVLTRYRSRARAGPPNACAAGGEALMLFYIGSLCLSRLEL